MGEQDTPASIDELKALFANSVTELQQTASMQEFMRTADMRSLTGARDALFNFGHDDTYTNPNDLDPEAALEKVQAFIDALDPFTEDEDEEVVQKAKRSQEILLQDIAGYQYRKEHNLPGVFVQVDQAREEFLKLYTDPEASSRLTAIMSELYQQADTGSVIDQLKEEYQEIMSLLEELSEDPKNMTLDVHQLWRNFYGQNTGLDFDMMSDLITRYKRGKSIQRNIGNLTRLADLQGNSHYIQEMKTAIPEQEAAILRRAAENISFRRGILEQEIDSAMGRGISFNEKDEVLEAMPLRERIEAELEALLEMYEDEEVKKEQLAEAEAVRAKLESEEEALKQKARSTVRKAVVGALLSVRKDASDPLEKRLSEKRDKLRQARLAERELRVTLQVLDKWRSTVTKLKKETRDFLRTISDGEQK